MEEKEIKQQCMELLKQTDALYLSTIDGDGFPQTRVMMNLKSPAQCPKQAEVLGELGDDFSAYMTTSTSSPKLEHIKRNPKTWRDEAFFEKAKELGELLQIISKII